MEPAGVADQQALPGAKLEGVQVLGDHSTKEWDDWGGGGREHGQVIEPEPDTDPAGASGLAAGAEVSACRAEVGSP